MLPVAPVTRKVSMLDFVSCSQTGGHHSQPAAPTYQAFDKDRPGGLSYLLHLYYVCVIAGHDALAGLGDHKLSFRPLALDHAPQPRQVARQPLETPALLLSFGGGFGDELSACLQPRLYERDLRVLRAVACQLVIEVASVNLAIFANESFQRFVEAHGVVSQLLQ